MTTTVEYICSLSPEEFYELAKSKRETYWRIIGEHFERSIKAQYNSKANHVIICGGEIAYTSIDPIKEEFFHGIEGLYKKAAFLYSSGETRERDKKPTLSSMLRLSLSAQPT